MQEKKRILLIPSDLSGVGSYRSVWPGTQLNKDFSDQFYVEINHQPNTNDIEYLSSFDIIHFHRQLGDYNKMEELCSELRKRGVVLIMDIDDYWAPPKEHPLYHIVVKEELAKKITTSFKMVDWVTTTTIYADYIKPYNPNVFVIPNAIDVDHKMWQNDEFEPSEKVRIAWIGGSSHMKDLENLQHSMKTLHSDDKLQGKYQMVLCGFDIRGTITEIMPDNQQRQRKILPQETIWNQFEQIVTDNYKIISEEHKKWLLKYKNEPYPFGDIKDANYNRRWTLPLTQYGRHYNFCDVCLAPLAHNIFNEVKSELKIIESGMKKKVLIAQSYGIYKELLRHEKNGLLVDEVRNDRGWYEEMKKVINNKDLRDEMANNLYNFVKDRYNLKNVTKNRVDFYLSI